MMLVCDSRAWAQARERLAREQEARFATLAVFVVHGPETLRRTCPAQESADLATLTPWKSKLSPATQSGILLLLSASERGLARNTLANKTGQSVGHG